MYGTALSCKLGCTQYFWFLTVGIARLVWSFIGIVIGREWGMKSLVATLAPLDPADSLPLYQQLQRALRTAIEQRVLGPDDALPAEQQLAFDLDVSRITVRKAIEGLVQEGLLT